MKAVLTSGVAIPLSLVDVEQVKKDLTHTYQPMGEEARTVESYRIDGKTIFVPRQYGLTLCKAEGIAVDDQSSPGVAMTLPRVPEPRDYQVEVLGEIESTIERYYDFIFRARTGFGKTICSLIIAARLGVSTVVIVDQENLMDQWRQVLIEVFGLDESGIGIIQGKKCIYEDKPVTLAMVHTLSQKTLPDEVYRYFGLMIVDEVHIAGAPTFSTVLMQFHAATRFGVSATPKRRDGLQKLLDYNLGKVRVYVADEHAQSSVMIARSETVYSWYANTSPKTGRFISEVTDDAGRNLKLADAAVMLYESGRDTLVLSDRIEQLQNLRDLCFYMGVPAEDMGVYTGQTYSYKFAKELKPKRHPEGYVRDTEYTPISLQLIAKPHPKKSQEQIKEKAKIIFATYQKFSKGVDVPRLAGGVDASPRATSEQVQGRILRVKAGKKKPIWITIADVNSYRALYMLLGRLNDYITNNSRLYELHPDGSNEPWPLDDLTEYLRTRHKKLKSSRIEMTFDGLNIVTTPESQIRSALSNGIGTARAMLRQPARPLPLPAAASNVRSSSPRPSIPSPAKPSPFLRRQKP